jgi:hypothetical protein
VPGWARSLRDYYRSPAVRARIAEYCGGLLDRPDTFSCWRLAGYGGERRRVETDGGPTPVSNADLAQLFEEGADICRSLADVGGTLLQLDVDYVDPSDPGEPYRHPEVVLRRLLPVHRVLSELFAAYRLQPRVVLTGKGYHFTMRAPLGSRFQSGLIEIGAIGESMAAKLARYGAEPELAQKLARGHEGAGRLLEHLAHLALHRLRGHTEVETTLADVPPPGGAPFVCLDLTAYADPLFERHCRCAFSSNQKAGVQGASLERPFVYSLPCGGEPIPWLLRLRQDAQAAASWAETTATAIPDVSDAPELLEAYRRGPVGRFHQDFDAGPHIGPAQWPFTYDRLTDHELPACVRAPLEHPNPLLLRPVFLRSVALTLWGLGWHPRSIAGIVASRVEQAHGWQPTFQRYDALSRGEFYVRLFCGAWADGLDRAADFACEAQRGRGVCEALRCTEAGRALFASATDALQERGKC